MVQALLTAAHVLVATPAPASDAVAEALFQEAVALMKRGAFAEACPKLEASQRREARSGTLIDLASCREHEGKTATAWAAYKDAAALARAENRRERAETATRLAAALEPGLSRLRVDATPRVPGEIIAVDGTTLDDAALGTEVPVDPGPHNVSASAPRHTTWSTDVVVGDKADHKTVSVPTLQQVTDSTEPPATPAPSTPAPTRPPPSGGVPAWAWVVGGAGAALMVAAVVFRVDQSAAASAIDDNCGPDRTSCPSSYDAAPDYAREKRDFGLFVGLGAAGIVGVAVATIAVIAAPSRSSAKVAAARFRPQPWIGGQRSGFRLGGEF